MQQLTQDLKKGHMKILEVPFPVLDEGQVLVRNHFSVISAGTEGKTVADARAGYVEKARSRKKEVQQVIAQIKKSGLADTYRLVMNKLEAYSPLGYACAGEVIAVGTEVRDIRVGDFVACGGSGAWHADVVAVSRNLCVPIPDGVNLLHAAFTTIGAIALQGVRQADLRIGETAAVIGLGLVGQLTVQILAAAGVSVVGIDLEEAPVRTAAASGAALALMRDDESLAQRVLGFGNGHGVDAVIICAGSSSTDPVNLAGALCRPKGKVVIVGGVPTGFDRSNYYRKELDLRMSCSYGPGRYDPVYEDKGVDYPIGHVRWTENRNMAAFVELLRQKKLPMDHLVSHTLKLEDAPDAYAMILRRTEPFQGIVIQYDDEADPGHRVDLEVVASDPLKPNVGFIGAGNFAKNTLLPLLRGKCKFIGVATAHGHSARTVADKYGFAYATDKADEIISDKEIDTVFIATRHHQHASYVVKALTLGKNVFVEKPLAITRDGLRRVWETHRVLTTTKTPLPVAMAGFNRRFAPQVRRIKEMFGDPEPKAILCRVAAPKLPGDHWVHDPRVGGGRIVGEVCHFVDLVIHLAGAKLASLAVRGLRDADHLNDTLVVSMNFENGSVATINYVSAGSPVLPKEYVEVHCNGRSAVIDDFKKMTVYGTGRKKHNLRKQNKGHKAEVEAFLEAIEKGLPSPIPFEEMYESTLATFTIAESIKR